MREGKIPKNKNGECDLINARIGKIQRKGSGIGRVQSEADKRR
jgi:hypothetical protein